MNSWISYNDIWVRCMNIYETHTRYNEMVLMKIGVRERGCVATTGRELLKLRKRRRVRSRGLLGFGRSRRVEPRNRQCKMTEI